ncbi:hypothetical protein GHT06_021648 [Daphnia sinensis]|uniref:CxC3 like cysteine cluster domain-containing protein n=1 Tax=Daphnia sinensis TaxID=1820382 RepID=A0AAD5KKP0_9CRUS|nr:hypothetical protein GHT06_021648 [Daphnia sinensis]
MYNEDTYRILKPEEFISCGDVVTRDIPVPCFSASFDCKKCKCLTAYTVTAGKKRVVIITKDGRFDLHFPQFNCVECGEQQFANEADFVVSGWWPSLAKIGSYFVSTSLLEMWRHLKHQTPGTSERKFVQTLSEISKMSHRCATIDRKLFGMASRQYDHLNFLLNTEINGQELFKCLACGKCPLAMHADGNMKLYRWMSALGVDLPSLFGDVGIVDTIKFLEFATKINSAKNPSKKLLYGGHWMSGAASTTGETTEQTNSKMSRYGSTTKHMSSSSKSIQYSVLFL